MHPFFPLVLPCICFTVIFCICILKQYWMLFVCLQERCDICAFLCTHLTSLHHLFIWLVFLDSFEGHYTVSMWRLHARPLHPLEMQLKQANPEQLDACHSGLQCNTDTIPDNSPPSNEASNNAELTYKSLVLCALTFKVEWRIGRRWRRRSSRSIRRRWWRRRRRRRMNYFISNIILTLLCLNGLEC